MKKYSEAELMNILHQLQGQLQNSILDPALLTKENILEDHQVCDLLRISTKTLRRYCKDGKISYFKMGGKYYYLRQMLYLNILKLNND